MNREVDGNDVFCRSCRTNQALVLAITANWEAEKVDEDSGDVIVDEEGEDHAYLRWRQHLEQRYPPVCAECLPRVEQKLRNADKQARALIWNDILRESQRRKSGEGLTSTGQSRAQVSLKSRSVPIRPTVRARSKHAAPDLSFLSLNADQSLTDLSDEADLADANESDVDDSMDWAPTPQTTETSQGILLGPQRFFEPLRNTGLEELLADKLGLTVPNPVEQTLDGDTVMASAASQDRQEILLRRRKALFWWLLALLILSLAYIISDRTRLFVPGQIRKSLAHLQCWWHEGRRNRQLDDQDGIWAGLRRM